MESRRIFPAFLVLLGVISKYFVLPTVSSKLVWNSTEIYCSEKDDVSGTEMLKNSVSYLYF